MTTAPATSPKDTAARNLHALHEMLADIAAGRVIEAFTRCYAADVRMQENEHEPTLGFPANLAREQAFLASVAEWHGFTVLASGAGGDHTFYESITEFTTTAGNRVRVRQVSIARWRDGRIVDERFVYDTGTAA